MEAINNFVAKAFRDTRTTALTLGVTTVVGTHTMMFLLPADWQDGSKKSHAVTNLLAAGAILWGARLV
jgi:hypothetical protein